MINTNGFKTEVKGCSVYGFNEKFNPDVIAFEKDWVFERSSGYAGYRNKNTSEWVYDSEYRTRKHKVGIDVDVNSPTCVVEWDFEIETREYGIKSITSSIKKITTTVSWEVDTEDLTQEQKQKFISMGGVEVRSFNRIEGEVEIDSSQKFAMGDKEWKVINEIRVENGTMYPNSVEIDFEEMTIRVE